MRWTRWMSLGLTSLTAILAVVAISCSANRQAAEPTAADKVARGARLAITSGCIDCHTPGTFYGTPDTTRMLSGSELGWEGPWGVTYPRNLTPDPETGIADWTEEDIVNAVRLGHRPDQTPILPPMPWPAYSPDERRGRLRDRGVREEPSPVKHRAPDRIPPGVPATGPRLTFPAPPEWDGRTCRRRRGPPWTPRAPRRPTSVSRESRDYGAGPPRAGRPRAFRSGRAPPGSRGPGRRDSCRWRARRIHNSRAARSDSRGVA